MFVRQGDTSEESALRGVLIPMVCVVAPPVADENHLSSYRTGVRGALFANWSLEDEGAWWQERPYCVGNGESFPFGLTCVLEAEVVHACGRKCECDVRDAISERAAYVEVACMEVCVPSA